MTPAPTQPPTSVPASAGLDAAPSDAVPEIGHGVGRRIRWRSRIALATVVIAALSLGAALIGGSPASAAASFPAANCNYHYGTGQETIVVRAPSITSENGGRQSVRYRSVLQRQDPFTGIFAPYVYGQWHQGQATPTQAWTDSARTWYLNGYPNGSYKVSIQVQYYTGSGWGGTTGRLVPGYHTNHYYSGAWHYLGYYGWCNA